MTEAVGMAGAKGVKQEANGATPAYHARLAEPFGAGMRESRERTDAALDGLRGAGRGVGELVDASTSIDQRLRRVEDALVWLAAELAGVGAVAADPQRAAELVGVLTTAGERLQRLEAANADHAERLADGFKRECEGAEFSGALDRRLQRLEAEVPARDARLSRLEPVPTVLDALGQDLARLDVVHEGLDGRLRRLETLFDSLTAHAEQVNKDLMELEGDSGRHAARLHGAEVTLAGIDGRVSEGLAESKRRADEHADALSVAEHRLAALEAVATLHADQAGVDAARIDELAQLARATDSTLRALLTDVAAQASQAADVRLTVRDLVGTAASLDERLQAVAAGQIAQAAQAADGQQEAARLAERAVALEGRVEELAVAVGGHAAHVDVLESTVKLLVDEQGQATADDPRIRYMRHTGAPHTPELYLVLGSQFSQDGMTKMVRRCRHCDYRQVEVVSEVAG